jgi:hypothetical protein
MKTFFSIITISLLSACVSGETTDKGVQRPSFSQLDAIYQSEGRTTARLATEGRSNPVLPGSGTLEYAGVTNLSEHAGRQILALTSLEVSFSDASVVGKLSNFVHKDGIEFDGTVLLSNGTFATSDSTTVLSFDLAGDLTSDSSAMSTVNVSGDFEGQFRGDNYEYIRGTATAVWLTNEGLITEEIREVDGQLIVKKQY